MLLLAYVPRPQDKFITTLFTQDNPTHTDKLVVLWQKYSQS